MTRRLWPLPFRRLKRWTQPGLGAYLCPYQAVSYLGLDWSAPEEPVHSRLDELFLQPGIRQQAPRQ